MQKSPFKFLDSFTKEDREIFFGRDKEIEELHSRVFESKILLVYGTSGTGKSSLINCGLANRFNDSDWLPVSVRRGKDINLSIAEALHKIALTSAPFEKALKPGTRNFNLDKLLRSVYLDHFKPIFLILDQFEELFIFGSKEEKAELIRNVARVIDSEIQCRFIFSMREEYLAGVTEFEKIIPSFLANRMRIEKMTRHNAINTIEGPCRVNGIAVEQGFAENLLDKLNADSPEVELTWLQVFLDKAFRTAARQDGSVKKLTNELLVKLGDVKDILGSFLDEQISNLDEPESGLVVLKSFVSVKGTRNQVTENEVLGYTETFGKKISIEEIRELIQKFISLRILRDKDESDRYELRHDSLASKIFEKITLVEKELLEVKYFIENAWLNYERRKQLLSEDDLNYIAPYEDKLYLADKYLSYIAHSKSAQLRSKRRRQNILLAAAAVLFMVLSFFTIWAMRERSNALIQQQAAETQKNEAVKARDEAETAKQEAITQRTAAESNAREAQEARKQSDLARQSAVASREEALKQKAIAENLSVMANEQARAAERQRQIADEQRTVALAAEEKARRLGLLSTAQNLALISQTLWPNVQIMALLSVQAYNFNKENGGSDCDPVIYKALEYSYRQVDHYRHSGISGIKNEIKSLSEDENGVICVDLDGNIFRINDEAEVINLKSISSASSINFVNLSPDGKMYLAGYENKTLIFSGIENETSRQISLAGHTGTVDLVSWSRDQKLFVTGGQDSLMLVWSRVSTDNQPIARYKCNTLIKSLTFNGNDSIFSSHSDGSIWLWDLRTSTHRLVYESHGITILSEMILSMAIDYQRGNMLAGKSLGTILVFDLKNLNNKPGIISSGHPNGIDNLILSKDFSTMVTTGWDRTIHIYNYKEYFEQNNSIGGLINIDNLAARARSIIFTKDGRLVASLSDRSVRFWETSSEKLASHICRIVNRDLSIEEWNSYIGPEIPYQNTCRK